MDAWRGAIDPSLTFDIDVTCTDNDKEQEKMYYERHKLDWDNEVNIRRAMMRLRMHYIGPLCFIIASIDSLVTKFRVNF